MSQPSWSDFRIILALERAGSVAGAARVLGIDGSTVSRRLAALERALGATLVVRGGGAFAMTQAGLTIARAGEAMEQAASAAVARIEEAQNDLRGVVRIACPPVGMAFLGDFQKMVERGYPGLSVILSAARAPVDLAQGGADIAIRSIGEADRDLIIAHRFNLGSALYASREYLDRRGRPTDPDDLGSHDLLGYAEAFLHLPAFRWVEPFAGGHGPKIRVDSIHMAAARIAESDGIGALYCVVGDATEEIERVFADPIDQMEIGIVYHPSLRGSARVRGVLDILVGYCRDRRATLSGVQSG